MCLFTSETLRPVPAMTEDSICLFTLAEYSWDSFDPLSSSRPASINLHSTKLSPPLPPTLAPPEPTPLLPPQQQQRHAAAAAGFWVA